MAKGGLETVLDIFVVLRIVYFGSVRDKVLAALLQQSALFKHSGERARRERPATETEEKDFVSLFIPIHEVQVTIFNVLLQADPKGFAEKNSDFTT